MRTTLLFPLLTVFFPLALTTSAACSLRGSCESKQIGNAPVEVTRSADVQRLVLSNGNEVSAQTTIDWNERGTIVVRVDDAELGELQGVPSDGDASTSTTLHVVLCNALLERLVDGRCTDADGGLSSPETFDVAASLTSRPAGLPSSSYVDVVDNRIRIHAFETAMAGEPSYSYCETR